MLIRWAATLHPEFFSPFVGFREKSSTWKKVHCACTAPVRQVTQLRHLRLGKLYTLLDVMCVNVKYAFPMRPSTIWGKAPGFQARSEELLTLSPASTFLRYQARKENDMACPKHI